MIVLLSIFCGTIAARALYKTGYTRGCNEGSRMSARLGEVLWCVTLKKDFGFSDPMIMQALKGISREALKEATDLREELRVME